MIKMTLMVETRKVFLGISLGIDTAEVGDTSLDPDQDLTKDTRNIEEITGQDLETISTIDIDMKEAREVIEEIGMIDMDMTREKDQFPEAGRTKI